MRKNAQKELCLKCTVKRENPEITLQRVNFGKINVGSKIWQDLLWYKRGMNSILASSMPVRGAMQLIKRKVKETQVFFSQSYKHVITFQKSLNCKYWSLVFEICSPRILCEYNRFSLLLAAKGVSL